MIQDPLNPNVGIDHHGKMFRKRGDTWVPIQVVDLCDNDPVDPRSVEW